MHGRTVCSCGALIAQCRCLEGHKNVTVLRDGCARCRTPMMFVDKATAPVQKLCAHPRWRRRADGTCWPCPDCGETLR